MQFANHLQSRLRKRGDRGSCRHPARDPDDDGRHGARRHSAGDGDRRRAVSRFQMGIVIASGFPGSAPCSRCSLPAVYLLLAADHHYALQHGRLDPRRALCVGACPLVQADLLTASSVKSSAFAAINYEIVLAAPICRII